MFSPTVRGRGVDEGLLAVDADAAVAVEQGVGGGAAVAHHVLDQVLHAHAQSRHMLDTPVRLKGRRTRPCHFATRTVTTACAG